LSPGTPAAPQVAVRAIQKGAAIEIDTGAIQCRIPGEGSAFIESLRTGNRDIGQNARLIALLEDRSEYESAGVLREEAFAGQIKTVRLEQSGPVRAVVKIEGIHRAAQSSRSWLPFTLRLYFYAGLSSVQLA
jgi:hypothetical protein